MDATRRRDLAQVCAAAIVTMETGRLPDPAIVGEIERGRSALQEDSRYDGTVMVLSFALGWLAAAADQPEDERRLDVAQAAEQLRLARRELGR